METRQVRAASSSMVVKTDRSDARGMAQLLRMGWFRPVHLKSMDAREQRALLSARETLARRLKDVENSVRGLLRGFGPDGSAPCPGRAGSSGCATPWPGTPRLPPSSSRWWRRAALLDQLGRLHERLLAVVRATRPAGS